MSYYERAPTDPNAYNYNPPPTGSFDPGYGGVDPFTGGDADWYDWGGRRWRVGTGPAVGDFNAAPVDINLNDPHTQNLRYIGGEIGVHGWANLDLGSTLQTDANKNALFDYFGRSIASGYHEAQLTEDQNALWSSLKANSEWLTQLGLTVEQIQQMIGKTGNDPNLLAMEIRGSSQWKARFGEIYDEHGQMRMSEADYLARERDYESVLKKYGRFAETNKFQDFQSFIKMEMDPNELDKRLELYTQIDNGGRDLKDAFYVYAGMNVSTDDLYQAVVNPEYAKALNDQYTYKVGNETLDYDTFIKRAGERARQEAELAYLREKEVEYSHRWGGGSAMYQATLREEQKLQAALNGSSMIAGGPARLPGTANGPAIAQVTDALYRGEGGKTLTLSELTRATELALLGAAATGTGLALPGKERVEALRQAGISRAQAQQSYGDFSAKKELLAGMGERAGFKFDQDLYERGAMLQEGSARAKIETGAAQETALGAESGVASFDVQGRRVRQTGLRRL